MRKPLEHIDDEALWERYRSGDEDAFSELFHRHYQKLLHYGLKITPDRQLAEDAIQELMIRLWTKQKVVGATESVRFYLLKSFRHILFRKLKQMRIYNENTEDADNRLEEISAEDYLIKNESVRLLQDKVKTMLSRLTPRQQEILYLRFYQNLSPGEIATLLDINTQSVSNIIHRAFIKIRETTPKTSYNSFISGILFLSF